MIAAFSITPLGVGDSVGELVADAVELVRASGLAFTILRPGVIYGRGEIAWTMSDKPFLGTPPVLTVSGEYVRNLASAFDRLASVPVSVTSNDVNQTTGWTAQITFGEAKTKHQWQVAYQYKYLEADATFDPIADDDFGLGGTDRKGHVIFATYNLQDWWQLVFSTYITEKISDRPNIGHNAIGIAGEDLFRMRVDTIFKF